MLTAATGPELSGIPVGSGKCVGISEARFVDLQPLDFRIECLRRESEFNGRTRESGDAALALCKCGFNHFLFVAEERATRCNCRPCEPWRLDAEPSFIDA